MFKRILIPIDGSEAAWHALAHARTLGEKFNSAITVIHVIEPHYALPAVAISGEAPFVTVSIEEVETTGYKLIEMARQRMHGYEPLETTLEFGHPAERIVDLAKEDDYDLIIMGSRGLSSIAGFFQGSTSAAVAHYSTIPVMLVK